MKTIGWLLSKMILLRFVTILSGISAFVVSLTHGDLLRGDS
jgi:hypothetical protein